MQLSLVSVVLAAIATGAKANPVHQETHGKLTTCLTLAIPNTSAPKKGHMVE